LEEGAHTVPSSKPRTEWHNLVAFDRTLSDAIIQQDQFRLQPNAINRYDRDNRYNEFSAAF
jgi:hypothetical protein